MIQKPAVTIGAGRIFAAWDPRDLPMAALAGLAYFALASATMLWTTNGHIASVWPPNAVIVAMLLPVPPQRWMPYLVAGLAANAAANIVIVHSFVAPLTYGVINIAETAAVAALLRVGQSGVDIMSDLRSVARFVIAAGFVAPSASAIGGAATAHFIFGESFTDSYSSWYLSDALGLLIFTPMFAVLRNGGFGAWIADLSPKRRIEAIALIALVMVVSLVIFSQPTPMLFAVAAPVMVAAVRMGRYGTTIGVTVVATIGTIATAQGTGPISVMFDNPRSEAHVLQFFLATVLLTTLPVSAELTARRRLAQRLKESEMGLRLLASGSDALLNLDNRGICRQASDAASTLIGIDDATLIGQAFADVALPDDAPRITAALQEAAQAPDGTSLCEFRPRLRDSRWMECAIKALADENGHFSGTIAAVRDITDRRQRELAATQAASTDSLTGTFTRAAFLEELDARLARGPGHPLALIMIDVDLFKQVNDTHGHPAGDRVLKEIVGRIRSLMRDSDLIGRMGGDEFAVLLDGARLEQGLTAAAAFAERVAAEPIRLRGVAQLVSISCGVAEATAGVSREILFQQADDALIRMKRKKRARRRA